MARRAFSEGLGTLEDHRLLFRPIRMASRQRSGLSSNSIMDDGNSERSSAMGDTRYRADTEGIKEPSMPEKKPKACLNCRRSKHRCLPSSDPQGRCVRCIKRNEECKYRTRLHDDEWQDWVTEEIKTMGQIIQELRATVAELRKGQLPQIAPPSNAPQVMRSSSNLREPMFTPDLDMHTEYNDSSPDQLRRADTMPPPIVSLSKPGNHNMQNRSGDFNPSDMPRPDGMHVQMAALVTKPEIDDLQSRSFPFGANNLSMADRGSSVTSLSQMSEPPMFMSIASAANLLSELGTTSQSAPGELQFTNDELGSNDPRPNVIHKGVLDPRAANVLFDYFVDNMSPMLPGFVLRVGEYPFLPTGKSTITPYILSAMTLIAAERLPAFHEMVSPLNMETSVACPLGLSVAADPHMERVYEQGGSEGEAFFNVELGIGPEEITGMSVIASFSTAANSHVAAKAALEWARGFAKGDDGQATRVLTLGEMCGYLSPRRWPARAQSHRLILFTFVIAVQQSIYRSAQLPLFNPSELCDELGWSTRSDEEIVYDNVLIAHVRLCVILQAWHAAANSGPVNVPALVDDYNRYLDRWVAQLDQACIAEEHRDLLAPVWLHARMTINLAGSNTAQQATATQCTRNAMRAARNLLDVFGSQRMMNRLPLLPPFLIEFFAMGCTLLLVRMSKLVQRPTAGEDELVLDAIDAAARQLLQGPLPRGHFAPLTGERLQTAVLNIKQRWRSI